MKNFINSATRPSSFPPPSLSPSRLPEKNGGRNRQGLKKFTKTDSERRKSEETPKSEDDVRELHYSTPASPSLPLPSFDFSNLFAIPSSIFFSERFPSLLARERNFRELIGKARIVSRKVVSERVWHSASPDSFTADGGAR